MASSAARPDRDSGESIEEVDGTLSYWFRSRQPLEILVFLSPFIVLYEIGMVYLLRQDQGTLTNLAHELIIRFMDIFGVNFLGLSLPAIIVVLVLLLWHVLTRAPWSLDLRTCPLMFLESIVFVLPLLVAGRVIPQVLPMMAEGEELMGSLGSLEWIALSIGAGLYEELVFRMLVVFVVHTLLVDLLKVTEGWALAIAILVSAVLFTVYHPLEGVDGSQSMARVGFYAFAGVWFGLVYVFRGFGIVVATHVFYDVAILLDGN